MSSCVKHRKPRRKLHHQPTDIDGLSLLLTQGSKAYSSELKRASRRAKKAREHDGGGDRPGSTERNRSKSSCSKYRSSSNPRKSSSSTTKSSKGKKGKQKKLGSSTPSLKMTTSIEDENDLNNIFFRLGSMTYSMDDMGNWETSLRHSTLKEEIAELAASNLKISQENNLLRVKNELLLDMIAKKNLRKERVDEELKRLRKLLSTSSSRFSFEEKTD